MPPDLPQDTRARRICLVLCLGLALTGLVLACFWRVRGHNFVDFDDPHYVTENPRVMLGLTTDNVRWAFTTLHYANWHPLTWISHMLDATLYGDAAGSHAFTSLLLHALNTVLVLLTFTCMTGAVWRSALVAALFAVHPLHVESVAWISERKDVLSMFFALLAMLAYASYARHSGLLRYGAVMAFFALGLMAKPAIITLPCVLLLMDLWPLRRIRLVGIAAQQNPRS